MTATFISRIARPAALAGIAALTLSATTSTAFALAPVGATGRDPSAIVRPTGGVKPVAPAPATTFTVTADSVVATSVVTYTGAPVLVTVNWGDNTTSARNPNVMVPPVFGAIQDPAGTVIFKHAYTPPADGSAFVVAIVAQIGATQEVRALQIVPRFRVIQYQAYFSPLSHCDSFAENYTEWRIQQTVSVNGAAGPTTTWRQDRQTNFATGAHLGDFHPDFNPRVLEGSAWSREMTMAEAHAVASYKITELDPIFDDEAGTRTIDLHPSLGSRPVELNFDDDSSCRAKITADVEVSLLKPGLNSNTGPGLATSDPMAAPIP